MLTPALALAAGVAPRGVMLGTIGGDVLTYDPETDDNLIITTEGVSTLGQQVADELERQGHLVTRIGPIHTLGGEPGCWEATYMEVLRDVVARARCGGGRQVLFIDTSDDFRLHTPIHPSKEHTRLGRGRRYLQWLASSGPSHGAVLVVHEHSLPPTWLVGCEPLTGLGLYQQGETMIARQVRRVAGGIQRGDRLGEVQRCCDLC